MKRLLRPLGLALILACALGTTWAAETPPLKAANNLVQTGKLAAARAVPVMLVFVQSDCEHCTHAEKEFIEPLSVSRDYGDKVVVRKIEITDREKLRDFSGRLTTHAAFARRYDVQSVPTVIVVDAQGRIISDPIIGLAKADFYKLYLEQAIDNGRIAMRQRIH